MSIEGAVLRRNALVTNFGKQVLNTKYPKEFELYIMALELIGTLNGVDNSTLQYFIFPVMPSSIDYTSSEIKSIKKTQNGVSVLRTSSFVPCDYNISGNFGRKFRVLLGQDYQELLHSFKQTPSKDGVARGIVSVFDDRVKTGYGCCKVLEDIINATNSVDGTTGVKTLVLHNAAWGMSSIIEPISARFNMSQDSNMIWNYSLQLKTVAPLSALKNKQLEQEERRLVKTNYAQERVNSAVNFLTKVLTP